eukprot:4778168-Amphidinium_carterae.1
MTRQTKNWQMKVHFFRVSVTVLALPEGKSPGLAAGGEKECLGQAAGGGLRRVVSGSQPLVFERLFAAFPSGPSSLFLPFLHIFHLAADSGCPLRTKHLKCAVPKVVEIALRTVPAFEFGGRPAIATPKDDERLPDEGTGP